MPESNCTRAQSSASSEPNDSSALLTCRTAMPFSRIKLARDGQVKEGKRWISTPMDVAKEVSSRREAAGFVIARVDGALWDMARPLEGDCQLELLGLDSKDGQDTFWHSSAHTLGEVGYCRL
jgi:hypothetical protein